MKRGGFWNKLVGKFGKGPTLVVFEKTGVLTEGRPRVTDVIPFGAADRRVLLGLAAGLEVHVEHPLAGAVLAAATEDAIPLKRVMHCQLVAGKGVDGMQDGMPVRVGTEMFCAEHGGALPSGMSSRLAVLRAEGKTMLFVSRGEELLGVIATHDHIRPQAAAQVADFSSQNIDIVLLSGDHEATAKAVAEEVGIARVMAGLSLTDKEAMIKRWQLEGERVREVGR